MSTIQAANISDGTLTLGTEALISTGPAAQLSYQQAATPVLQDSYNISSVTDTATGRFSHNYTNSLLAADQARIGAIGVASSTINNRNIHHDIGARTTSVSAFVTGLSTSNTDYYSGTLAMGLLA